MKISGWIVRSVVAAAAVATLGTVGAAGARYDVKADARLVEAPSEDQMTKAVIGGQSYTILAAVLFLFQGLCVQCVAGLSASAMVDVVALVECTVICDVAF